MKRVCKNVDIESIELIQSAVHDCLRPSKKRKRGDTRRLFADLLHVSTSKARRILLHRGELYEEGVRLAAEMLRARIRARRLDLPPVYQRNRIDPGSRKVRKIAILSIEQLMLDHVACHGLQELTRRIGAYQVSSIPKRGAAYGKRGMEKWLRKKSNKHAAKLDIRDFYGSVKRPKLLAWLHRRIKNRPLLWLIGQLIYTVPRGLAIGSYLSQTLANLYLSDLYHLALSCRGKRGQRQVNHTLFQMDDIVLIGSNKRQLRFASYRVMEKAGDMGLQIKPNWHVFRIAHDRPVDVIGFRFSAFRTTLRGRIFVPARRSILREGRALRKGRRPSLHRALRLASYNGYTKDTACHLFLSRSHARLAYDRAFTLISQNQKKHYGNDTTRPRAGAHAA